MLDSYFEFIGIWVLLGIANIYGIRWLRLAIRRRRRGETSLLQTAIALLAPLVIFAVTIDGVAEHLVPFSPGEVSGGRLVTRQPR